MPAPSQLALAAPEVAPVAQAIGGGITYTYGGTITELQMQAALNCTININATSDFLWRATCITARLAEEITLASQVFPKGFVIPHGPWAAGASAAAWGVPGCLTMGNFRGEYAYGKANGMNIPIPLDQISGNARNPYFLPTPFRIPANTVMNWKVYNDIIASTAFSALASAKVNIWVTLLGEAI